MKNFKHPIQDYQEENQTINLIQEEDFLEKPKLNQIKKLKKNPKGKKTEDILYSQLDQVNSKDTLTNENMQNNKKKLKIDFNKRKKIF